MAWTTPRTWVAGELVTAAIGNTHWRDNQTYLYNNLTSGLGSAGGFLGGSWNEANSAASYAIVRGGTLCELDGDKVTSIDVHFSANVNAAGTANVRLWNNTTGAILGSAVNITSTSPVLSKITGLTPTSGVNEYQLEAQKGTAGWVFVWGARFVQP